MQVLLLKQPVREAAHKAQVALLLVAADRARRRAAAAARARQAAPKKSVRAKKKASAARTEAIGVSPAPPASAFQTKLWSGQDAGADPKRAPPKRKQTGARSFACPACPKRLSSARSLRVNLGALKAPPCPKQSHS